MRTELIGSGMRILSGDNAIFYKSKEGQLDGMCVIHIEEFLISSSKDFHKEVERKIKGRCPDWKIKRETIKMPGLNIVQKEDGIYMDQNEHIQSMKEAVVKKNMDKEDQMTQEDMKRFREMKFRILIATDVAARGLDVPHIEHVINYDLPQLAEDFIRSKNAIPGFKGLYGFPATLCISIDNEVVHGIPKNRILCEPQMGKRSLRPTLSTKSIKKNTMHYMNFLQYADGKNDLKKISKLIKISYKKTFKIYNILTKYKLIT